MEELDKAYEAVEMLRDLGLPVTKEQLENINRLEMENGIRVREDVRFYYYEQSYTYYTKQVMNIRQAKIRGEIILAIPVLLLAIIDGIESGVFTSNEFSLTEWLEKRYVVLMMKYMRHSQFDKPTDISNPFWHLQSDGFWHLSYVGEQLGKSCTPSKAWLKENIEYAYFDDDLWLLLQNDVWRMKLRNYIIEYKLTDGSWFGKIAAEGLGIIVALLLAA